MPSKAQQYLDQMQRLAGDPGSYKGGWDSPLAVALLDSREAVGRVIRAADREAQYLEELSLDADLSEVGLRAICVGVAARLRARLNALPVEASDAD
ncbi:hypothetical protein LCGC14_1533660 [marine sediment metagenome]|uniref:Uncharacterized protein n=1 Tax=marine sediment metagenome TaxID=412755 RepID=A0A0F9JG03_9ZZZZ